MQDHFLQLGLDPEASSADIEATLKAHPDKEAAAQILLNPRRRGPYQRAVSTLRSIGMLRHRLGLDNEDTWFVKTCPDFAPRLHSRKFAAQPSTEADAAAPATVPEAKGAPVAAAPTAGTAAASKSARSWLPAAIAILVLAAVLVLLALTL